MKEVLRDGTIKGRRKEAAARRAATGQSSAVLSLAVSEDVRRPHASANRRLEAFTLVALVPFAPPCGRWLRKTRARMAAGDPLDNVLLAC